MTKKEAIKKIEQRIARIDEELAFAIDYINAAITNEKSLFQKEKDNLEKCSICYDAAKALESTGYDLRKLLTQRNVLQDVLKLMNKKETNKMIKIKKSPSADTRSADHEITEEELKQSTYMHIQDVRKAMRFIVALITDAADKHDYTKIMAFKDFYYQFHQAQMTGQWGKGWFDETHIVNERHHLKDNCPEDVNLIDVLEMLCDCVMAGLARSGAYREEEPDAEMLVKAYKNTVKLLISRVKVEE